MAATESDVFFQGRLQAGIALALSEGKVVVAFVTDDGDQSKEWEHEFLTNDTLRSPLESKALVFRLQAGSEEAGFLEALFPVPKNPTVIIIRNATLKEYIANNATKEDLVRRVVASLDQVAAPASTQGQAPSNEFPSQTTSQVAAPSVTPNDNANEEQQQVPQPQTQTQADTQTNSNARIQAMLLERAKRLEADKKAKEAKEKAEREARAKQRRETGESSNEGQPPNNSNISDAERSYAESVRQRKVQAAEERKRILKRIEDDRRERKEREAQERQARLLLSANQNDGGSNSHATQPIPMSTTRIQGGGTKGGEFCNLQVRLFDGSTLRARFKSDATLANEVRKWIDEERTDDDTPYTFRVLLTPLPNKVVDATEEIKSLLSLGLAPSATLVLVRAKYASAYAGAGNGGIVGNTYAYIIGIFSAIYAFLFGGIVNAIFGRRGAARQQQAQEGIPLRDLGASTRIRGFQNPNDRRDQQLYNGNSLNFEPRRDEDEDHGSS